MLRMRTLLFLLGLALPLAAAAQSEARTPLQPPPPPPNCLNDASCAPSGWCRPLQGGGSACTPFVGQGQTCGGFVAPWSRERCAQGLTCIQFPFVNTDFPGTCEYTSKICGHKFRDVNCNGKLNHGDGPLAGFTIVLVGPTGQQQTATTDAQGNYCFEGLLPGQYQLFETAKPGWVLTYPNSGQYTVQLQANVPVLNRNFGNQRCTACPHKKE